MQYIDEVDIKDKRVLLRCDFNVPIKNGVIVDDERVVKSLKTINYLLKNNCSIIIMSHLGRVNTREDKIKNTLEPVANLLKELLRKNVKFFNNPVGMPVLEYCKSLKNGEVVLLENTRFCDFPEKLESHNDLNLAKYWSTLADVFVVDSFGSLHRKHASVAGVANFLPTYFGLLVKDEINGLSPIINDVKHPYAVFMGGAKVDDKLCYIKNILPNCDYLLIGGGIANSFLYACGYDVGDSLCTSDELTLQELKDLVSVYKDKIIMPIDFSFSATKIADLGYKSIEKYKRYLNECKTIFINGSCGIFEESEFARGTRDLFLSLNPSNAYIVAGGGDTLNAIKQFHLDKNFSYLSTGGGASLEYISSGHLEAIDYINDIKKS